MVSDEKSGRDVGGNKESNQGVADDKKSEQSIDMRIPGRGIERMIPDSGGIERIVPDHLNTEDFTLNFIKCSRCNTPYPKGRSCPRCK